LLGNERFDWLTEWKRNQWHQSGKQFGLLVGLLQENNCVHRPFHPVAAHPKERRPPHRNPPFPFHHKNQLVRLTSVMESLIQECDQWRSDKVSLADLLADDDQTAFLVHDANGMVPDRLGRVCLGVILCKTDHGKEPARKLHLEFMDPNLNRIIDQISMDHHLIDGFGPKLMAFNAIMLKFKAIAVLSERLGNNVVQDSN